MKKFKGGLYADLSNYNTTLPNTNVLLNFFKSNPIGYRSGGMVRGIAGGNPTGMRVTGGFLANAQRLAQGTDPYDPTQYYQTETGDMAKSAYYRDKDVTFAPHKRRELSKKDLVRLGVLKKITKTDKRGKVTTTYVPTGKTYIPPEEYYVQQPGARIAPDLTTEELRTSEMMETPMSKKDAELLQEISRLRAQGGENAEAEIQQILAKPESEGGISEFTKKQMALGTEFYKEKPKEEIPQYTGGEGSSQFGEGITGLTQDESNKIKEKRKETQVERELEQDLSKIEKPNGKDTSSTEESTAVNAIETKIKENKDKKNKKIDKNAPSAVTIVDGKAKNMFTMTPEDWSAKFQGMAGKSEAELNDDEKSLSDRISKALNPDKKDKGKEAPGWAMPLMMAGLQMAASNNPDMLGALAEGGIKGLEEYARLEKEKKEDEKYEQEMNLKKAGLIFDEEQIKISKDQMNLSEKQLSFNIASAAQQSWQEYSLANAQLVQQGRISEEQLKLGYFKEANILKMHGDGLAQELLTFMADHELKQQKLELEGKVADREWWKTQTGFELQTRLITSEVNKNNALAEAAGFEMGTVESSEIGGNDMEVQIWRDKDGIHMKELGLSTDETSTALLQAYMRTNPDWYDEYTTDSAAFFEKLAAIREMNDIIEGEGQKLNLPDNVEEIPLGTN